MLCSTSPCLEEYKRVRWGLVVVVVVEGRQWLFQLSHIRPQTDCDQQVLRKDKTARKGDTHSKCVSLQMSFPQVTRKWKKGMNDLSIRHSCSVEHKGQVWLSLESLTNGNNCRSFVDKKPWLGLNLLWVIAKCKQTELLESVKAGLSVDKCWQSERLFTRTWACSSFSCAEKQNPSMRCVFRPLCEYNLGKLARAGPAMEDRPQMEFNIAVMARESFSKCHSFHFSKLKFKTELVGGPCSASPSLVKSMDVL